MLAVDVAKEFRLYVAAAGLVTLLKV